MRNEYDIPKERIMTEKEKNAHENKNKKHNAKSNINNLINKKFEFGSEFDHKGAKNFLKSKKIALQQIILDDNDFCENETVKNDIKPKLKINSLKKISNNSNSKKKKKGNNNISNKIKSCTNISVFNKLKENGQSTKDDKNPIKGKMTYKYYSRHELKMFIDKGIKKIKSIKKVQKTECNNKNRIENLSFLEKNDSSIMELLTELA